MRFTQVSHRSRTPRRAKDPVRFLIIVGIIGVVILGSGYVATNAVANSVLPKEASPLPTAPTTKLLSVRRAPTTLSTVTRTGQLRRALQNFKNQVPNGSCASVEWMGQEQLSVDSTRLVIPASAQKIVTAVAALEVLTPGFTFETSVFATGDPASGTVQDLYFVGGGDPLLVRKEYIATEKYPTINPTSLETLADSIVASGVRSVTGSIVGVDTRYDAVRFLDVWPAEFRVVESGPLGALVVNDGAVVGATMKPDNPAVAASTELRSVLGARGVLVSQDPRYELVVPANATKIATVSSAPLSAIVQEMLVNSDNNTAELLLKEIGFARKKQGTTAAGISVIQELITTWKLPTEATVVDGSGLSSLNKMSCANFLTLLAKVEQSFPALLPIAGKTGTLRSVFNDSAMDGRLVGKTGTLTGVKALAGYLPLEGNSPVRFALVMNASGIDNQGSYRPIWLSFGAALNKARAVPTPEQLMP
ncbi:MAG: D-alanyl-D-alanine carboxypeptidase/D-alanyl-D-alanine-endopeptidase [Ilumatobacteraceae bacterium]